MIYLDTSMIVKLYVREAHSREVSEWLQDNDEAIPLTLFTNWNSRTPLD